MAKQSLLSVVLGLKSDQFERGITRATRQLDSASKQFSKVGRNLSLSVTAPLAVIGASSFKASADFELAMKKVKAVSGATGSEFKKLEQNARDLGSATVFSASQVSELQLEFAKLGFSADQITKVTENTLALAQAFDQDLGQTATVVGSTLRQFGLEAEEAGRVTDIMATAFGSSALDLEKFSEGMKNAGPVAKTFGFSLEETTALLGVLANNGIAGSDAGTKLKVAFQELAKSGVDVKKTFTQIINEGVEYTDAIDLLGSRSAILTPIFGDNLEALEDLGKGLESAGGSAKRMAEEMNNTASGGIASMKSAIEGAQIAIGDALAPTITSVAQSVQGLARSFSELSPETQSSVVKIGLFASSIGPLSSIIGRVIKGVRGVTVAVRVLTTAISTNPLGALATALAVVGTALVGYASTVGGVSEEQQRLTEEIRATNLELAKQAGELKRALDLDATKGSVNELRDSLSAINSEIDNFNPTALSQNIDIKLDRGIVTGITGADILNPQSQKILTEKLRTAFNLASGDALRQGLFGDSAQNFIDERLRGVVLRTVSSFRDELISKRNELDSALKKATEDLNPTPVEPIQINTEETKEITNTVRTLSDVMEDLNNEISNSTELSRIYGETFDLQEAKTTALQKAINELVELGFKSSSDEIQNLVGQMNTLTTAIPSEDPFASLKTSLAELETQRELGFISEIETATRAIQELEQAIISATQADENFVNSDKYKDLNSQLTALKESVNLTSDGVEQVKQGFIDSGTAGQVATSLLSSAFDSATGSVQSFGESARGVFVGLLKQLLSTAIANAITSAFSPASPDNIATGGLAGVAKAGALTSAVTGLFNAIPKFAEGGMVLGPTLAMVGDNPSGREAIIPFEKMGQFLGQFGGGGGNVTGKIKGSDIYLSSERSLRQRGR